jgi:hypothetical protein
MQRLKTSKRVRGEVKEFKLKERAETRDIGSTVNIGQVRR